MASKMKNRASFLETRFDFVGEARGRRQDPAFRPVSLSCCGPLMIYVQAALFDEAI